MKTYRFALPNGRTQTTSANREDMIGMIDAAISAHPMEVDPWGRMIVTNEFLFAELVKQIEEALNTNGDQR